MCCRVPDDPSQGLWPISSTGPSELPAEPPVMGFPSAGLVVGFDFYTGADLFSRGILPLVTEGFIPDISENTEITELA